LIAWSDSAKPAFVSPAGRLIGSSSWTVRADAESRDRYVHLFSSCHTPISFSACSCRAQLVVCVYVFINQLFFGRACRVDVGDAHVLGARWRPVVDDRVLGESCSGFWTRARARPLYIVERTLGFPAAVTPHQVTAQAHASR